MKERAIIKIIVGNLVEEINHPSISEKEWDVILYLNVISDEKIKNIFEIIKKEINK